MIIHNFRKYRDKGMLLRVLRLHVVDVTLEVRRGINLHRVSASNRGKVVGLEEGCLMILDINTLLEHSPDIVSDLFQGSKVRFIALEGPASGTAKTTVDSLN
jgi:hypothetical protein